MSLSRFALAAVIAATALPASAAPVTFSGSGADAAAITDVVNQFRAAIGGNNNGNTTGSQATGRREINWDGNGSPDLPALIAPSPLLTFTNRGSITTSPGGGRMEFSGQPSPLFGDINAQYPTIFQTFSPFRLFAPIDNNVLENTFNVPGTAGAPALTSAFGVVFADVDLAETTKLEFFDINGALLETVFVPVADNGLSFVGVDFDDAVIARVRMTLGNAALGPNDGDGIDVVVTDDFIFAEPQRIPEPATLAIVLAGLAALTLSRRRT